jgi:hypothetical protein
MTDNVLQLWPEILAVIAWGVALLLFAVTLGMSHRPRRRPGSEGHRGAEQGGGNEAIQPDGYIDSFAGEIEEAGGGLPPVLKLVLPAILLWWLLYLILYWKP